MDRTKTNTPTPISANDPKSWNRPRSRNLIWTRKSPKTPIPSITPPAILGPACFHQYLDAGVMMHIPHVPCHGPLVTDGHARNCRDSTQSPCGCPQVFAPAACHGCATLNVTGAEKGGRSMNRGLILRPFSRSSLKHFSTFGPPKASRAGRSPAPREHRNP